MARISLVLFFVANFFQVFAQEEIDICSNAEINGTFGLLISPNFPQNYPNDTSCTKSITPPQGKLIEINFQVIDIEQSERCIYDNLTVFVGEELFSGGSFCSQKLASNFTSEQTVTFHFSSDETEELQGFRILWRFIEGCGNESFRCWNGDCIKYSQKCDGVPNCFDQSDEIECSREPTEYGDCGKNIAPIEFTWDFKIVGGNRAINNSYPYMAALFRYDIAEVELTEPRFFCGGTIISDLWLITAAHCIETQSASRMYALVGTNSITDGSGQNLTIDRVIRHPQYDTETLANDIALIRLSRKIEFTDKISPICLTNEDEVFTNYETCILIGWGALYSGARFVPNILQQTRIPVIDNEECKNVLNETFGEVHELSEDIICTTRLGTSTCQGDSGGPLLCLRGDRMVQFGITSFGFGRCGDGIPNGFNDVRAHVNWIESTTTSLEIIPPFTIDICDDIEVKGDFGFIISPNFPGNYENFHKCSKRITPPKGKLIEVNFQSLDIEPSNSCEFDNLTVTIMDEVFSGHAFCNRHIARNFTTEETINFTLQTDHSVALRGFRIYWKFVDDCDGDSFRCWDGSCISASKKCDGIPDCPNQADEVECGRASEITGECGKNAVPVEFTWDYKIVGGNAAKNNSYPWMVPLFVNSTEYYYYNYDDYTLDHQISQEEEIFICGATIINEEWLMTAAHCIENFIPNQIHGYAGAHSLDKKSSVKINFHHWIIHPNYTLGEGTSKANDIALLHVDQQLIFNEHASPICLPNTDELLKKEEICVAIGWGRLFYDGPQPNQLHQVRQPIVNYDDCFEKYSKLDNPDRLPTEGQICAGTHLGGSGVCHGDSGGPLMCLRENSWVQFGVVSWAYGCALPNFPEVYTDVRFYSEWIVTETEFRHQSSTATPEPESTTVYDLLSDPKAILEGLNNLAKNINPIGRLFSFWFEASEQQNDVFQDRTDGHEEDHHTLLKRLMTNIGI